MDYVTAIAVFVMVFVSYMIGRGSANGDILTVKRENERLNAELGVLTKRDSKGRFTGGK
jgi:hypothetical protein